MNDRANIRWMATRSFGDLLMTTETALYLAQLGRCFHCGGFMPLVNDATRKAVHRPTRDHLVPMPYRAAYPAAANDAVVMAHRQCNQARADAPPSPEEAERARMVWRVAAGFVEKHGDGRKSIRPWLAVADAVPHPAIQTFSAQLYDVHEAQMRIYTAAQKASVRILKAAGCLPA